ncbi:MAG: CoA-binding protein [Bacteroidetes bacterium]|nr:CoA-binding protein [Bacteroidota bacterium]
MKEKRTLVLGASTKEERYSNKAIRLLQKHNIPIIAVGNREGEVNGTIIRKNFPENESVHTVTLYLSEKNQEPYYDKIIALKPERVIFNPGTENPDFEKKLNNHGIETEEACTLVLLHTNAF